VARASYGAVHDFLSDPAYAGVFVFGRQHKQLDERGRVCRRTVELPIEQWSVCNPRAPSRYVFWSDYLQTREPEPSGRHRTEVGPVQGVAVGRDEAVVPTRPEIMPLEHCGSRFPPGSGRTGQ
jgi:hypothetical protein